MKNVQKLVYSDVRDSVMNRVWHLDLITEYDWKLLRVCLRGPLLDRIWNHIFMRTWRWVSERVEVGY